MRRGGSRSVGGPPVESGDRPNRAERGVKVYRSTRVRRPSLPLSLTNRKALLRSRRDRHVSRTHTNPEPPCCPDAPVSEAGPAGASRLSQPTSDSASRYRDRRAMASSRSFPEAMRSVKAGRRVSARGQHSGRAHRVSADRNFGSPAPSRSSSWRHFSMLSCAAAMHDV